MSFEFILILFLINIRLLKHSELNGFANGILGQSRLVKKNSLKKWKNFVCILTFPKKAGSYMVLTLYTQHTDFRCNKTIISAAL